MIFSSETGKNGSEWSGKSRSRPGMRKAALRCPCSIPEDMPIDLRIIATRIKVAPYCGVIYAALQPLREVLEVAAFLAKVLGEIFRAFIAALVSLVKIIE